MRHPERPGYVTIAVHGNEMLHPKTLRSILTQASRSNDELRDLLSETQMRYTVLLTPETDPDVSVAYVPVLGVVTQGATVAAALEAAQEAAFLEILGRLDDGENAPVEEAGGIVAYVEVEFPVPAGVS